MSGHDDDEEQTTDENSDDEQSTDENSDDENSSETPELSEEGKEEVQRMRAAYEDKPTAVMPGTDRTITGTAVNEWLDDEGNPKFGKDEGDKPHDEGDEPHDESTDKAQAHEGDDEDTDKAKDKSHDSHDEAEDKSQDESANA